MKDSSPIETENTVIGFAPELVSLIKEGTKALTYRLGDKYCHLKIGDIIQLKDSSTDEVFAQATITEISMTTFVNLPLERSGHERYASKERQRALFTKYYQRKVDDNEQVIVLGYKVLKLVSKLVME